MIPWMGSTLPKRHIGFTHLSWILSKLMLIYLPLCYLIVKNHFSTGHLPSTGGAGYLPFSIGEGFNSLPSKQDIYHLPCTTYDSRLLPSQAIWNKKIETFVEYGIINDDPQYSKLHEHFKDCKEYSHNILDIFLFDIRKTMTDSMMTMSGNEKSLSSQWN